MTLLEDLITLLGVALQEVFKKFNGIVTLLEDLQLVAKPTLLRDFDHYYSGKKVTMKWPDWDATELLIQIYVFLHTRSNLIK